MDSNSDNAFENVKGKKVSDDGQNLNETAMSLEDIERGHGSDEGKTCVLGKLSQVLQFTCPYIQR